MATRRTVAAIKADLALLDTLRANILSGGAVKGFSIGGKTLNFHTLADILAMEKALNEELGDAEGSSSVILADLRRRAL